MQGYFFASFITTMSIKDLNKYKVYGGLVLGLSQFLVTNKPAKKWSKVPQK